MTRLIYILGKRSKTVRLWYYRRTNRTIWGIMRYIKDTTFNPPQVQFPSTKEAEKVSKATTDAQMDAISEMMGVPKELLNGVQSKSKSWSFSIKDTDWFDKEEL